MVADFEDWLANINLIPPEVGLLHVHAGIVDHRNFDFRTLSWPLYFPTVLDVIPLFRTKTTRIFKGLTPAASYQPRWCSMPSSPGENQN